MDFTSVIMGAALLALFASPFILIGRAGKKNKKQLFSRISQLAENNNSKIQESDHCGEFMIGLDEPGQNVYFVRREKNGDFTKTVKLRDFQTVRIINQGKTLGEDSSKITITGRLALAFVPAGNDKPEVQLEFYNSEDKNQITRELELLVKWSDLIKQKLRK